VQSFTVRIRSSRWCVINSWRSPRATGCRRAASVFQAFGRRVGAAQIN
jgi:hypothetical protein